MILAEGDLADCECSSASRKFLNNRGKSEEKKKRLSGECSSASRKFLNNGNAFRSGGAAPAECSSASRKFLNNIAQTAAAFGADCECSSASRKFLNNRGQRQRRLTRRSASALQRAENSSIIAASATSSRRRPARVLFSEPKIPQ